MTLRRPSCAGRWSRNTRSNFSGRWNGAISTTSCSICPPGTGDIQLTIVQTVALAGAVIVTTPQEVALIDARKAATMFEKVNVPVLGLIENMSYFLCPSDGKRYDIFGSGGGRARSRSACRCRSSARSRSTFPRAKPATAGMPITAADPANAVSQEFLRIAENLARVRCNCDN